MCVLSVVATSSCSKEDFFGLNEYETLDYSKKTEIALSQEFTDYYLACIEVGKVINQWSDSIDTTKGAPQNYTGESLVKLLDKLKEAFPELLNADDPDFDDIRKIALSKNKTLKALAKKNRPSANTKYFEYTSYYYGNSELMSFYLDSDGCISYLNYLDLKSPYECKVFYGNGYALYSCAGLDEAISRIICSTNEQGNYYNIINSFGCVFSEGAIAVINSGEQWPSALNNLPVAPEKDFYFLDHTPDKDEKRAILLSLGSGMEHILLDLNGEVL